MFAGLSPGRRAIAVPFVLDGRSRRGVVPPRGTDGQRSRRGLETVQILGSHATSVRGIAHGRFEQRRRWATSAADRGSAATMHCSGGRSGRTNDDESERTTVREAARLRESSSITKGRFVSGASGRSARAPRGGDRSARGGFTISGPRSILDETRTFNRNSCKTLG